MPFDWLAISTVLADSADQGLWPVAVAAWPAVVAVAAIGMGYFYAIVKSIISHRERMAKIGMGVDPDGPCKAEWSRP